jgi:myo-inositol-1(or 4)-monophosphatase
MVDQLLQQTVTIVRSAGLAIMAYYQDAFNARDKSPDNPVTDADLAADKLLREELLGLLPQAGWLSEETADQPMRLRHNYVWVVDPLDGTKEFIMGIPEFAVSVALVEDGQPVLGVIYNPPTAELFTGYKGGGVHYNGHPVGISARSDLAGALVPASRSEVKKGEFEPFAGMVKLRIVGSIAYKLAQVAAGQADATWSRGPKHEWDICAGAFLVTEAGGKATDLSNEPLLFNRPYPKVNGIVANNGRLHEELMATLAPHGAARSDSPPEKEQSGGVAGGR